MGSGAVGGGLRATTVRRLEEDLVVVEALVGVFSTSLPLMVSKDCSPTESRLHVRVGRSTGLRMSWRKFWVRFDMPAARVGLLIALIGLWDMVIEDLRRLGTRGDGGTDADVGVVADGGPFDEVDARAECVRRAASFGRRDL